MADDGTKTTPAHSAMVSTVFVLPEINGQTRTMMGKPHVVNEGTTAVATIDVAMMWVVSPHFVNM